MPNASGRRESRPDDGLLLRRGVAGTLLALPRMHPAEHAAAVFAAAPIVAIAVAPFAPAVAVAVIIAALAIFFAALVTSAVTAAAPLHLQHVGGGGRLPGRQRCGGARRRDQERAGDRRCSECDQCSHGSFLSIFCFRCGKLT